MADLIFIGFVLYVLIMFIYKSWQYDKDGHVSSKDINKYYNQKIELDTKYRNRVPPYDKNGNPYTTMKQCADKVGVYSKEHEDELKALKSKIFEKSR